MNLRHFARWGTGLALVGAGGIGCGGDGGVAPPPPPPPPAASCNAVASVQLAVGQHQVIDPSQSNGCLRVPAAGAGGAEYLVVAASTSPIRTETGVSGPYFLRASTAGAAAAPEPAPAAQVAAIEPEPAPLSVAQQFHDLLRRREAELARDPAAWAARSAAPARATPPPVGDVRTFKVCGNLQCSSFKDITATARFVGTKAAIYMDNAVTAPHDLLPGDYEDLGNTFDTWHYPIDLASFGQESDIDGNDRIIILMTAAVNQLTPDCSGGRVLGYFYGVDLITSGPNSTNSNRAEIFYTLVPAAATAQCTAISRQQAVNNLKPTLIHELQHMISWNQRVILRGGNSEEIWLNEALSHFAEELGGRIIPAAECIAAGFVSCRSQYISSNIVNAFNFLQNPEATFLIYPTSSQGTLNERGASWYFLRWVVDQFALDSILGPDLTIRLLQTTARGAENITAATGESFSRLVVEWLLAAYLDDRDDLVAPFSPRLRFRSWGLREIFLNPANSQIFNQRYPLDPAVVTGGFTRSGTLRGGTGFHLRVVQQANGPGIDLQLLRNSQGQVIDPALAARFGIVRIR